MAVAMSPRVRGGGGKRFARDLAGSLSLSFRRLQLAPWHRGRRSLFLGWPKSVEVQDLLHELVGGEGHSLGGHAADVVERQAAVQPLLHAVLAVHVL